MREVCSVGTDHYFSCCPDHGTHKAGGGHGFRCPERVPVDLRPEEEWRERRESGWYRDIGYLLQGVLSAHQYGIKGTLNKPDDPGWHACTCGWEGYWSAFHPHVADHLRAVVMSHGTMET